ncbi:ricin-type beta-trefoil lectin domain protein, partial [Kibdelosporangium lantanae]
MRRRAAGIVVTLTLLVLSAFGAAAPASAATTQQTFLTFYGWWDNTPPGGDIAYPQIHSTAGGKGSFDDPITFATSTAELKAGTKVWVPRVRKYFIMEDGCDECDADWNGHGPNGGPNLWHFDLWLGGKGGDPIKAIQCENALTHYNEDSTPTLEQVIVDPPSNEKVSSDPIFNTRTGECYGGAKPEITTGPYANKGAKVCLDDPDNSSTNGFKLGVKKCDGSAEQNFTFDGTFLSIHDLCADSKGGNILFKKCTGGPTQQWSANPNGTISDIQTGKKCFRATATAVTGTDVPLK